MDDVKGALARGDIAANKVSTSQAIRQPLPAR
jgi:hypothetical protein